MGLPPGSGPTAEPAAPAIRPPFPVHAAPQVWSEELFKLAMNILAQNASRNTFLRKA